jgi:ribose transport system substrate-binding protein
MSKRKTIIALLAFVFVMMACVTAFAATKVDYASKPGKWVIGLSNSYYGNTWRKQMVNAFIEAADLAKKNGWIADYEVQNGDNTINSQIAQINSFILKGVDAIVIDPASPTALNAVLQKANEAGIKIITFDANTTSPYVYAVDFNFIQFGEETVEDVVRLTSDKAKVVIVRGLAGSSPDEDMYGGNLIGLKKYPNIEVLATVFGDFSATKTQEELTKILPSLTEIDAVITQCGGDSYGAAQAFQQTDKFGMPLILGDNSAEFLKWWSEKQKTDPSYKTISRGSCPSVSSAALWVALCILNDYPVPQKMVCDYYRVTEEELDQYMDMEPGTIISPTYEYDWVVENVIKPYLNK